MNFFDLALKMEQQLIDNYHDLAEACMTHEGIRNILKMLASDQEKHIDLLEALKNQGTPHFNDARVLTQAKTLFEKMKADRETFSCDIDQARLYRRAHQLLLEKQKFYQTAIQQFDSEKMRLALERIAQEESKQAMVLDNIITMVSRPEHWIENAEFNHLDEY